jgi:predicted tellurium resistance membrane protein TerC
MDIVFSIDNIFAVVAYTPNLFLICAGVFIGILAMRYVAKYFVVLMEKYPYLEKSAFIVIGILGLKLCFSVVVHYSPKNFAWVEGEEFDMYISALTLLIFFLPIVSVQLKGKKKT